MGGPSPGIGDFSGPSSGRAQAEPMRHSELWQDDEANRPRFDAAFWGDGGIERTHRETAASRASCSSLRSGPST